MSAIKPEINCIENMLERIGYSGQLELETSTLTVFCNSWEDLNILVNSARLPSPDTTSAKNQNTTAIWGESQLQEVAESLYGLYSVGYVRQSEHREALDHLGYWSKDEVSEMVKGGTASANVGYSPIKSLVETLNSGANTSVLDTRITPGKLMLSVEIDILSINLAETHALLTAAVVTSTRVLKLESGAIQHVTKYQKVSNGLECKRTQVITLMLEGSLPVIRNFDKVIPLKV